MKLQHYSEVKYSMQVSVAHIATAAACWIWAGLILGVSFIATPVKFMAPSLSLPVGLDVGRHVFSVSHQVQMGTLFLIVLLLLWHPPRRNTVIVLSLVAGLLAIQLLFLMPVLDARVAMIIAGQSPPPASHHWLYGVAELLKLALLIGAGVQLMRECAIRECATLSASEQAKSAIVAPEAPHS